MNCVLLVVGVLFLPIGGLRLHALVCGASPMCRSEYYCCCLHYPPFHSLPLTEQGCSHGWATSTFVGFYCCGEEAIAIERALVALPKTGRWEPGLQMVRGSLGGRETTRGSKTQGFPRWLLSPLFTSPAHLFLLSVCSLACLWTVLSSWHDQWPSTVLGCQVWVHSSVTGGELCSSVVGRWRVSWSSRQGWGGAFFPQICTWLSGFSSAGHKRPLTVWNIFIDVIFSSFFPFLNTVLHWFGTRTFEGNFICWVHWGQAAQQTSLAVWKQLVCLLTGLCGAGKGGCTLPNVCLLTPSRKYQKALYEVL